jgi:hypothetical protein
VNDGTQSPHNPTYQRLVRSLTPDERETVRRWATRIEVTRFITDAEAFVKMLVLRLLADEEET